MTVLLRTFLRRLFWCWIPCAIATLLLLIVLGTRGEPFFWSAASTWFALLYAVVIAAFVALPPASLLCVAISASIFWRGGSNQLFQRTASGGR